MKKISSLKITLAVLGLSTVASLVGSISGTIAWYAYSTRALISYSGTSVSSSTQLQIGLKSTVAIDFAGFPITEDTDLRTTTGNVTTHYYFMNMGSGGMSSKAINHYLATNGYTQNILEPLSTYTYNTNGTFNLRNRPTTNRPESAYTAAEKSKYVHIDFVFRVLSTTNSNQTVGGQNIYLKDVETSLSTDYSSTDNTKPHIDESLRLYFDRNGTDGNNNALTDFILNPKQENNGRTKVTGPLDLSGDGIFDHGVDENLAGLPDNEYVYGEYDLIGEGTKVSDFLTNPSTTPPLNSTPYVETNTATHYGDDVNGAGSTDMTTFTAKHAAGVNYFDSRQSANIFKDSGEGSYIKPHYAEYLGKSSVLAQKTNGSYAGSMPLCRTSDTSNSHLGEFGVTIYLEGWDFSVVDSEQDHKFYLGMTFEIDPVNTNTNGGEGGE